MGILIQAFLERNLNKTVLAVMIIGVLELCSDYFAEPEYSEEQIKGVLLEETIDIFMQGILKR